MKTKNILNERPRRKNNKKFKASKIEEMIMKRAFEKACNESMIGVDPAHSDMADAMVYALHSGDVLNLKPYKKPEKEMNFLQAFIILLLAVFFFFAFQRAVDNHALNTCELRGDCTEVIRDINNDL